MIRIAIIGGGAAGFFAAISAKQHYPKSEVFIYEKTNKILSKVRISGGGRCNVTNACPSLKKLSEAYPRGKKLLKKAFFTFNNTHTMDWFESRGVKLKVEANNHVFPVSDSSQSIIDCLLGETKKLGITIFLGHSVQTISQEKNLIQLTFSKKEIPTIRFNKVIIASGGTPKLSGLLWLKDIGHKIETPIPSLFTFNMPQEKIKKLMGVVAQNTSVNIQGTKLKTEGPLLVTHWGMSGPAILKLSAFGARILHGLNYECKAQINWINIQNQNEVLETIKDIQLNHPKKQLGNIRPFDLPNRLWIYLLNRVELKTEQPWGELGKKSLNKLVTIFTNDIYQVKGKTTFKEEFVTSGGVSLDSINANTLESKAMPNLYFAGEVMDIDGITGGYNFQAAWTTGYIAGQLR